MWSSGIRFAVRVTSVGAFQGADEPKRGPGVVFLAIAAMIGVIGEMLARGVRIAAHGVKRRGSTVAETPCWGRDPWPSRSTFNRKSRVHPAGGGGAAENWSRISSPRAHDGRPVVHIAQQLAHVAVARIQARRRIPERESGVTLS